MTTTTISSGTSGYSIPHFDSLVVDAGATSSRSIIGGLELVSAGGDSDDDFIESGGSGRYYGSASDTVVRRDGILTVESGGIIRSAIDQGSVSIYGSAVTPFIEESTFVVFGGGVTSAQFQAGDMDIEDGATASDTADLAAGDVGIVSAYAGNTVLYRNGVLGVGDAGSAYYTILDDGAHVYLTGDADNLAVLNTAFFRSGSILEVSSGGFAEAVRLSGGAQGYVSSGGVTDGGYLLSNGYMEIDGADATVSGLTVSSGADLVDTPGAAAEAMLLRPGAELTFYQGSATAIISGGALEVLNSDNQVVQSMTLAGGGTGIGVSVTSQTAFATDILVTTAPSGAATRTATPTLLVQTLAGFGDAGTLAGSAVSHSGGPSALFQMAKPSQAA